MRYNLEHDLLKSSGALNLICDKLSLAGDHRTASHILSLKILREKN
jgi:hypothetical protein